MKDVRVLRPAGAVTALLLLGLGLAGCGGDGDDASISADFRSYCAVAKENQSVFADDGTGLGLVSNVDRLKKIADAAPDDLDDEWQTFLAAVTGLRDAVEQVGLKPTDFVGGQPPASTPEADKQTVALAADRLGQEDVVAAANGIEQQAKDVCKFQLGL